MNTKTIFKHIASLWKPFYIVGQKASKEWGRFEKKLMYRRNSTEGIFRTFFRNNHWGNSESVSGPGSTMASTAALRDALPQLFKKYNISTFLDAPCGDHNWIQHADLSQVSYIGADIVPELIAKNELNYGDDAHSFITLNLISDPIPKVDMIMVRDCLVHLNTTQIMRVLANIKQSNVKYILLTTFSECETNKDIITGFWRKLNFQRRPFNFSPPLQLIKEQNEWEKNQLDKCMGLWDCDSIMVGNSLWGQGKVPE
jgi:hypothetical protein